MKKKLMTVFFTDGATIESAMKHVAKWNEKAGEKAHPDVKPHERLEGTFTFGGAIVRIEGSEEPKSFPNGVKFETTYQGNSWAPICIATCFAFENWLKENGANAILVTHQEVPLPDAVPGDER